MKILAALISLFFLCSCATRIGLVFREGGAVEVDSGIITSEIAGTRSKNAEVAYPMDGTIYYEKFVTNRWDSISNFFGVYRNSVLRPVSNFLIDV